MREPTFAAPTRTGHRWHIVVDDHAACSPAVTVLLENRVPVARVAKRRRCHRPGCAHGWPHGISEDARQRESLAREQAEQAWVESQWTRPTTRRRSWESRGWLEPHLVYVLHLPRHRVYRVGVTRNVGQVHRMERQHRGVLVDVKGVSNRFAALLIKLETLAMVDRWRVELPKKRLDEGGTEVWYQSGPTVDLDSIRADLDVH